jgi:hypothetical protein
MRLTDYIDQDHGAGKDGMLAIAVHPGGVKTELAQNVSEDMHRTLIDEPELAGDMFVWISTSEGSGLLGGSFQ